MDIIGQIFGTLLLFLIILIGFGMLTGVKVEGLIRTYLNFIVKLLEIAGELLAKLAIPVIKQIGEKIVYVAAHYLEGHKIQTPVLPTNPQQTPTNNPAPAPQPATQPQPGPQPNKQPSANPYDDPPKPEIMD